jgi:hypothetical protein
MFCLKLGRSGWRLLADGGLWAQTQDAKAHERWGRQGRVGTRLRRVPPWRRYYVTRNYIAEMRRTFDRPDVARREVVRALGRSAAAWRHGAHHGVEFTRFQTRAVLDGYRGRPGRTVEPIPKGRRAPDI